MLGARKKERKVNWRNGFIVILSFVKRVLRQYRTNAQREAIDPEEQRSRLPLVEKRSDLCKAGLRTNLTSAWKNCVSNLVAHTQLKVSKPTMCRAAQRLEMLRKKNTLTPLSKIPLMFALQRDDYRRWLEQVDVRNKRVH